MGLILFNCINSLKCDVQTYTSNDENNKQIVSSEFEYITNAIGL